MRLQDALTMWAGWMRGYRHGNGYDPRSAGFDGCGTTVWDDLEESVDKWICEAVDSAVDDLPIAENCAIMHRYTHSVFRFPRGNYPELLLSAHERLEIILRKKGVDIYPEDMRLSEPGGQRSPIGNVQPA